MALGVATVWLPVTDLDRAIGFYDGLGLSTKSKDDDWAELEADGLTIGLNAHESPAGGGGAVIAFRVDDIEAAVSEYEGKGVTFTDGVSKHPWGQIAPFQDPDGNDLQLYAAPQ